MGVDRVRRTAAELAEAGDIAGAMRQLELVRDQLPTSRDLAHDWVALRLELGSVDAQELARVAALWPADPEIVALATLGIVRMSDRVFDDPIEQDDPMLRAARGAEACWQQLGAGTRAGEAGGLLAHAAAMGFRLAGPEHDAAARTMARAAIASDRRNPDYRRHLGLIHKWRGRWEKALDQYERADRHEPGDADTLCDLGICATALGRGEIALDAWRRLGIKTLKIGADGLPAYTTGSGEMTKVRLTEGFFAGKHPGHEDSYCEHVWVQMIGPCHGWIANPTAFAVGADYSDVILFDLTPIGVWGDGKPRFAALSLLRKGKARTYPILTRAGEEALAEFRRPTHGFYLFPTAYTCSRCIRTGNPHGRGHPTPYRDDESAVKLGKLVIEPGGDVEAIVEQLSRFRGEAKVALAVRDLFASLGRNAEEGRERSRWAEIGGLH